MQIYYCLYMALLKLPQLPLIESRLLNYAISKILMSIAFPNMIYKCSLHMTLKMGSKNYMLSHGVKFRNRLGYRMCSLFPLPSHSETVKKALHSVNCHGNWGTQTGLCSIAQSLLHSKLIIKLSACCFVFQFTSMSYVNK